MDIIYKINTYKVLKVGEMAYWLVTLNSKYNTVVSFLGFLFASNILNCNPEISMVQTRKGSKENSLAGETRKGQATKTETLDNN